jgi:alpha-tubulin suppressor-like RCC1 family protein
MLCVALAGCAPLPAPLIRLQLRYDESWGLTALEVHARGEMERIDPVHEIVMLPPPAWALEPLEIRVVGYRGDAPHAAARAVVIPRPDGEVSETLVLTRLPCGAWCTEGATQCEGDAIVLCVQRDGNGCFEWSEPIVDVCADSAACVLGQCRTPCFDECAAGDRECVGPREVRTCGNADSDPCHDWEPAERCADGETCSSGACRPTCLDECTEGEISCRDAGVVRCGDRDVDGCFEWGPIEPCNDPGATELRTCEDGACVPIFPCEDRCTASVCAEETFRTCGNYDFDACAELSVGLTCVPSDPCREGRCSPETGCSSTPAVCLDPPATVCSDDVLVVHDAIGACAAGVCEYPSRSIECPGCSCDPCVASACTNPPSGCYDAIGSCSAVEGRCVYAPLDGIPCDDGDPETTGELCAGGACLPPTGAPLALGGSHTCARIVDGTVSCWGSNASGELGDGTMTSRPTPAVVPDLEGVVALAAGPDHTCAVLASGEARCWGRNTYGQLGDGTTEGPRLVPTPVSGLTDAIDIAVGDLHTCALRASGAVSCWGRNVSGQLGDGRTIDRAVPGDVLEVTDVVELSVGSEHTCARRGDGVVECWGVNSAGQLGDGSTDNRWYPTPVLSLEGVLEIAASRTHSCARLGSGSVRCWGSNRFGELGAPASLDPASSPQAVAGVASAVELALGSSFSCARLASGSVSCWGANQFFTLGDGTDIDRHTPGAVVGLPDAIELRAGQSHVCALRASGGIVCWGNNGSGQLGDDTMTSRETPTAVVFP